MRAVAVLTSIVRVMVARIRNPYEWRSEIARQCQELGGVYVKFLQMLAVHKSTQYIVKDMGAELAFEQVPYEPLDLQMELGRLIEHFSRIEPKPFAAGSYGQVYMAWLKSGEQVVVKILRPSVRRTLKTDLRLLKLIGILADLFSRNSMINFRRMSHEFAQATWLETNYQREAENGERLREYFEMRNTLVIPRSYTELATRTVLVQEYIGGVSIASLQTKQRAGFAIDDLTRHAVGSDIWLQLRTLGTELLRATVYADYLMIDPHPGNVRLLPNNKVALIDFGLIAFAPSNREAFATLIHEMRRLYENDFRAGDFTVAMLAFFDAELHDALEHVASRNSTGYTRSLRGFVDQYVIAKGQEQRVEHYLSDKQLMQLFSSVLNQNNKLGIHVTEENALLQRSMTMFMSVVRAISDGHTRAIYESIIRDCMVVVDEEIQRRGVLSRRLRSEMSDERAYEVTANWLATIAERDRNMYQFITARRHAV